MIQGYYDDKKRNTLWTLDESWRLTVSGEGGTDFMWLDIPWAGLSEKITEIYIDRGITDVFNDFVNMPNLRRVVYSDTVKAIYGEFKNCPNVIEFVFPESLCCITDRAFECTEWFKSQPNGAVYAGKVYYRYKGGCSGGELHIKEGTAGIARGAFKDCENIRVSIPESVLSVGMFAFEGSCADMNVTDRKNIMSSWNLQYDGSFFIGNDDIRNFHSPDEQPWKNIRKSLKNVYQSHCVPIENIGSFAFADCENIETVVLSSTVKTIGAGAFQNCKNLRSIKGLDGVRLIEKGAFSGCINLTEFSVPKLKKNLSGQKLVAYNELHDITFTAPPDLESLQKRGYTVGGYGKDFYWTIDTKGTMNFIGEGSIPGGEKYNPSNPKDYLNPNESKRLIIDERITEIGYNVFKGFCYLSEVILPKGLKHIGYGAFEGNSFRHNSLESIYIPDGVKTIGDWAFAFCSSLKSVKVPNSVKRIGTGAFAGCASLAQIYIPENVSMGERAFENTAFWNNSPTDIIYLNEWAIGLKDLIPADTVLEFKKGTRKIVENFSGDPQSEFEICEITGVVLDNDITHIGTGAFGACKNLENVSADCTFKHIGSFAFGFTKWAESQPQGLVYLANALLGCKDSVRAYSRGGDEFTDEVVNVDGTHDGRKITLIADSAFSGKKSVIEVILPDSIEAIGAYAFEDCSNLKRINLAESLKHIGYKAFYSTGLKEIHVPASVEYIGEYAFGYYRVYDNSLSWDKANYRKTENFKITGAENSAAEKYARENGFEFIRG